VDSLISPHCGGEIRFLAVIEETPVIERIPCHIGTWGPSPAVWVPPNKDEWSDQSQIPLTYHPVPDVA